MSAVAALMAKKRQKQEEAKLKAAGKKDPKTTADDADALSKKMDALRIADAEKAKEEPRSKNDSGAQWERQFRHEQETMEELGLRIRKVEGDGACLFRAFGEVFEGDEERHDSVRKKCVEFMKDHEADFAPFVEDSFAAYLEHMSLPTAWGGDVEVQALSRLYGANVLVHIPSTYEIPELEKAAEEQKNPFAHYQAHSADDKTEVAERQMRDRRRKVEEKLIATAGGAAGASGAVVEVAEVVRAAVRNLDAQLVEMSNFAAEDSQLVQLAYHPYYHSGKHYNLVVVAQEKGGAGSAAETGRRVGEFALGKWKEG